MKKGFTLVEVLIVIVILGLISAMAIPAIKRVANGNVREDGGYITYIDGHKYIKYDNTRAASTLVHSPECPVCKKRDEK